MSSWTFAQSGTFLSGVFLAVLSLMCMEQPHRRSALGRGRRAVINSSRLSNVTHYTKGEGRKESLLTVHEAGTQFHDPSTAIFCKAHLKCLLGKPSKITPRTELLPAQTLHHPQAINCAISVLHFIYPCMLSSPIVIWQNLSCSIVYVLCKLERKI